MNEILSFWAQWLRPSAGLPTVQWSLLLAVADSILVMHEGTVKAHGPRDQVLAAIRSGNGPTAGGGKEKAARPPPPVAAAISLPAAPIVGA